MGDEHINPELLKRLGRIDEHPQPSATPSSRYRRDLDPALPASMQPGATNIAIFWIGYFIFFLIIVPILIALL
ncbi:hypothetical protein ABZ958_03570 [Streptomyces sp. NPDC046237]|uniref:hypothetical protein n=1 Tax=Streptomyces sp. NPDC046237 TaxID=3154914 RepID=UPI0033D68EC6